MKTDLIHEDEIDRYEIPKFRDKLKNMKLAGNKESYYS